MTATLGLIDRSSGCYKARPLLRAIVLDFDGTFTLVDQEAAPFVERFRELLARALPSPLAWDVLGARIDAEPGRFGWEHDGRIVAPAYADPYVRATSIAQLALGEAGVPAGAHRDRIEPMFRDAYARSLVAFRPDAREVCERLLALEVPMYVVTNSATQHVEKKLEALGARGRERIVVRGDARKFVVAEPLTPSAEFSALPASEEVPGLPRPVWLRRGPYFDVLSEVRAVSGAAFAEMLIVGDIYELDLAMPARLGARIHHVARPATPASERAAVARAGGTSSEQLAGVLDVIG